MGRGGPPGRDEPRSRPRAAPAPGRGDCVSNDRRAVGSTGRRRRRRIARGGAARSATPGNRRPGAPALPGDGVRLPLRPDPQALLHRLPGPGRHARSELLRPPRLRGPPGQLPRDRQGGRGPGSLVPARTRADARRSRLRPDLLVRVHVRVPDARSRDARSRPQPARPHVPAGRGPPDELRRRARRALGHVRVGIQRAGPRADLPVLELRRARPGPEAGPERRRRGGPVRDRPRSDDPARGRGPELRPAHQGRRGRSVRLSGGARLHGAPPPRRGHGRDREELHGASPGDGAGGPGQRAQRPRDDRAVPRRPDGRGDGAAAPGADAARRARGPAARRGGEERRRRARPRAAGTPSLHLAPRHDARGRTSCRTGGTRSW